VEGRQVAGIDPTPDRLRGHLRVGGCVVDGQERGAKRRLRGFGHSYHDEHRTGDAITKAIDKRTSCKDEARVGQKGSLECIWAPIGSRPPMVRDNRHDSVYLFGAICHARGVGAAIIMPTVNTEAMNEHLKEISTQVSPGAHAVLVCDGAGWHQQGKRLRTPHNVTILRLLPDSPELNPMENIWDYLRGNKLSRLVWDSYEAIVAACKDAWDFLMGDHQRIKSIAHRSWAWVNH
jgi:hypothetical protein